MEVIGQTSFLDEGPAVAFCDNQSVVKIAHPDSLLHKRHNALAHHRVREACAAGVMALYPIPGTQNPADILSKHWGHAQIWDLLQPLLFNCE